MRLLALFACLGLVGCAHPPGWGGDTARLRLVSLSGARTEIRQLAPGDCPDRPTTLLAVLGLGVRDGVNQGRSERMPLQDSVLPATATELVIPAGRPFAARFQVASAPGPRGTDTVYPACVKSFVLTPAAGENYEVQVEQFRGGCVLNVFHLDRLQDGRYVRRETRAGRELRRPCE